MSPEISHAMRCNIPSDVFHAVRYNVPFRKSVIINKHDDLINMYFATVYPDSVSRHGSYINKKHLLSKVSKYCIYYLKNSLRKAGNKYTIYVPGPHCVFFKRPSNIDRISFVRPIVLTCRTLRIPLFLYNRL